MSKTAHSWSRNAILIVGLCFLTNMVDGMDVNIMSYVRGALSKDWGIADKLMGPVMSAGTFGMGIGALAIAPFADRFGRKPVILLALALMSAGMLACGINALVHSVTGLMIARLVVGMGIGTVLATMAALAAESAPEGKKDMAVGFVQAGFPLAAVATGFIIASAMPVYGWQNMLLGAGVVTLLVLPAAWVILPAQLPAAAGAPQARLSRLFGAELQGRTVLLMVAVFMGLLVLYSMLSWITKLATAAGLSETNGIYAGAFYNLGAFLGTASMGFLALRFKPSVLLPVLLTGAGAAMLVFGYASLSVAGALFMAFVIGVTLQGGYNAMWPLTAGSYPEDTRATGIGLVMGVGRGGAVVGPTMAGFLLDAKMSLGAILATYCVPLAICALCAYAAGKAKGFGGFAK